MKAHAYQKQELYRRRGQNALRMQEGAPPNTEPSGMDEPFNQLGGDGDAERRDRHGRTGMNVQRYLGVCFCFAMIPDTDKPRRNPPASISSPPTDTDEGSPPTKVLVANLSL
jgi:hypothetical protein